MIELMLWAVVIYVGLWALVGLCVSVWAWCRLSNGYVAAFHESQRVGEPRGGQPAKVVHAFKAGRETSCPTGSQGEPAPP